MNTTTIKWDEGEGHITATYEGSGNGSTIISSDINEGVDREQDITVATTKGSNPKSVGIKVKQLGMREMFNAMDGGFTTADGEAFNVLKE